MSSMADSILFNTGLYERLLSMIYRKRMGDEIS